MADSSRKPWNDAWEIMLFVMLLIMLNSLCNFAFFGTNGFFPGENNKMIFHHLPPNPLYIYIHICMIFFYIDVSSKISTKNDQPWFFPHQHGPQPNRGPELPGALKLGWFGDDELHPGRFSRLVHLQPSPCEFRKENDERNWKSSMMKCEKAVNFLRGVVKYVVYKPSWHDMTR